MWLMATSFWPSELEYEEIGLANLSPVVFYCIIIK